MSCMVKLFLSFYFYLYMFTINYPLITIKGKKDYQCSYCPLMQGGTNNASEIDASTMEVIKLGGYVRHNNVQEGSGEILPKAIMIQNKFLVNGKERSKDFISGEARRQRMRIGIKGDDTCPKLQEHVDVDPSKLPNKTLRRWLYRDIQANCQSQ